MERDCELCGHPWRSHDPADGKCDCLDREALEACRCGRDLAWMQGRIVERARAALERHVIGPVR